MDVFVTAPGGTSAVNAPVDQFTFTTPPAPTVTGVSPNTGSGVGGTSVTITGTNFSGASAVQFGTVAATAYTVDSATQITATAPAEAASTVDVFVTAPGGTSAANAPVDQFTFSTSTSGSYSSLVTGSPGLLAYWRLGETSGTTATDTTGTNNGSYVNGPALGSAGAIAGDPDTSVTFNGTNQRVTLPSLAPVGNFSIEGWTYLTSAAVTNNTLYGDRSTVRLLARPGTGPTTAYAGVTLNATEYVLQPNSSASNLNTWVYWVLTRQGGTLTLYRNGVQIAQRTDLPATAIGEHQRLHRRPDQRRLPPERPDRRGRRLCLGAYCQYHRQPLSGRPVTSPPSQR